MNPTTKRPSAVQYAEQTLGVHLPWEDAQQSLLEHGEASAKADDLRRSIRGHKQRIEDRKMEILTDAPSMDGWPDKVTAQKDFIKMFSSTDEELNELESQLDASQAELEQHVSVLKHRELQIHLLTSRMNELGGLLNFYAAAKQAENHAVVLERLVPPEPDEAAQVLPTPFG